MNPWKSWLHGIKIQIKSLRDRPTTHGSSVGPIQPPHNAIMVVNMTTQAGQLNSFWHNGKLFKTNGTYRVWCSFFDHNSSKVFSSIMLPQIVEVLFMKYEGRISVIKAHVPVLTDQQRNLVLASPMTIQFINISCSVPTICQNYTMISCTISCWDALSIHGCYFLNWYLHWDKKNN